MSDIEYILEEEDQPESSKKYQSSASHSKTMEIVGKTKKIDQLSFAELKEYCLLVIDEVISVFSPEEVALELMKRYKWNAMSRLPEIEDIWNQVKNISSTPFVQSEDYEDCTSGNSQFQDIKIATLSEKVSDSTAVSFYYPVFIS
jgi:hypothetical protein